MFEWLKGEKKTDSASTSLPAKEPLSAPPRDAVPAPSASERPGRGERPASERPGAERAGAERADRSAPRAATTVQKESVKVEPKADLSVDLGGASLPNPVMTASGCAANGRELDRFFDVSELGAFVTKTVMANPRSGRGTPRMAETPSGMLNSIGLQGPGIEAFCEQDLPWLAERGVRVLVSIAGSDAAEFAHVARVLRDCDAASAVAGVEINISCPNVANRGLVFSCDTGASAQVVSSVVAELPSEWPTFAKLTADVTDIVSIARAALEAGATGLTAINTLLGIRIDTTTMRPHLGGITGGLSGPAMRPVAVRAVWQLRAAMLTGALPTAPIIGVGGIASGEDALEFIAAGASAVQVGTVTFHDPNAPIRVRDELALALDQRGIASVREVVGAAHG